MSHFCSASHPFYNRMGRGVVGPEGIWGRVQGVGSDPWVLEVNPERDSIRVQRGRARSALFSRVLFNTKMISLAEIIENEITLKSTLYS